METSWEAVLGRSRIALADKLAIKYCIGQYTSS
jgi:hypothetical protein